MAAPKKKPTAKKSATKKTAKATVVKQNKVNKVEKEVVDQAKQATNQAKGWFEKQNWEENIYTILGIIFLLRGLIVLKDIIGGIILLIIGVMFITGFIKGMIKKIK